MQGIRFHRVCITHGDNVSPVTEREIVSLDFIGDSGTCRFLKELDGDNLGHRIGSHHSFTIAYSSSHAGARRSVPHFVSHVIAVVNHIFHGQDIVLQVRMGDVDACIEDSYHRALLFCNTLLPKFRHTYGFHIPLFCIPWLGLILRHVV